MSGNVARPGMPLGRRELQILHLIANGHTDDQISARLGIARPTTIWYARRIFAKLGVGSRAHAVAVAFVNGLITPDDINPTSPEDTSQ